MSESSKQTPPPPPPAVTETSPEANALIRQTVRRWFWPLVALVAVIVFGVILQRKLRNDVWGYYTDGEGLRVAADEKKERMVLWEDPQQHVFDQSSVDSRPGTREPADQSSQQRIEAAFSPDGAAMVLTRWKENSARGNSTDADLYLSNWDGRTWSRPKPIAGLNTRSNEREAAFSRDGRYLYFSSDRAGGAGGFDLYVARNDGTKWTAVTPLGSSINSAKNESGPAPSAEGDRLYFSSDRESGSSQDIFVAKILGGTQGPNASAVRGNRPRDPRREPRRSLPPVPRFAKAELVGDLSSPADDVEAALTSHGSYVFLASDRDRNSRSGFNLYLSRVIDGRIQPPQRVDVYIQQGNATAPAVRMQGFDLLFSADGDLAASTGMADESAPAYRLYRSTTREVIGYTDLSRWELFKDLMHKIQWLILFAVASLIALIYLLEKWRDITSLFHKCLAASAGVHLLGLLFMAFWLISQAIDEEDNEPAPEVAISVDALAQEELAMESEQELAEVMDTTQMVVTKSVQELPETNFEPQEVVDNPVPIAAKTPEQSMVSDVKQAVASESDVSEPIQPVDPSAKMVQLPIELPVTAAEQMELAEMPNDNDTKPIDPTKDDFQHDEVAIQQIEIQKANVEQATSQELDAQADTESVARSNQISESLEETENDLVEPITGLEAIGPPPELAGSIAPIELSVVAMETLETAEVPNDNATEPIDPAEGEFQPDGSNIQQVESQKTEVAQATSGELNVQAESDSVASSNAGTSTSDSENDLIQPTSGFEAIDPALEIGGSIGPVQLSVVAIEAMETAEVPSDSAGQPVDSTKDDFQPDGSNIQQVEIAKANVGSVAGPQMDVQAETGSVASSAGATETADAQSDTIQPTTGLEATGEPNELAASEAIGDLAANLPGSDMLDIPDGEALEAPAELDVGAIGKHIKQQRGKLSNEMVQELGGSTGTERAIGLGLDWFTNHQEPDGRWEMSKYQGKSQDNIAGAGLALLCYYGWGIKHGKYTDDPKHDRHSKAASKALEWLLKQQDDNGSLLGSTTSHGMYCHGIATVALCEGYGLTKDPKLKGPATKAIDYILKSQHSAGGWRYKPGEPGDLSVSGWQYLAMHSARLAGIEIPDEPFTKMGKFLDSVSGGTHGGYYGYLVPEKNKPTMTATGMFLRQLDRAAPTEPRMQESAQVIKSKMLRADSVDFYFDYYATLALYQHQGPIWQEWNKNLKEIYLALQKTTGPNKGSWDTKGTFVQTGGRVVSTGLGILNLEVYYRLLPIYGYDRNETQKP